MPKFMEIVSAILQGLLVFSTADDVVDMAKIIGTFFSAFRREGARNVWTYSDVTENMFVFAGHYIVLHISVGMLWLIIAYLRSQPSLSFLFILPWHYQRIRTPIMRFMWYTPQYIKGAVKVMCMSASLSIVAPLRHSVVTHFCMERYTKGCRQVLVLIRNPTLGEIKNSNMYRKQTFL